MVVVFRKLFQEAILLRLIYLHRESSIASIPTPIMQTTLVQESRLAPYPQQPQRKPYPLDYPIHISCSSQSVARAWPWVASLLLHPRQRCKQERICRQLCHHDSALPESICELPLQKGHPFACRDSQSLLHASRRTQVCPEDPCAMTETLPETIVDCHD